MCIVCIGFSQEAGMLTQAAFAPIVATIGGLMAGILPLLHYTIWENIV
jgi:hypothetical protein